MWVRFLAITAVFMQPPEKTGMTSLAFAPGKMVLGGCYEEISHRVTEAQRVSDPLDFLLPPGEMALFVGVIINQPQYVIPVFTF
jgi:hypothetical protein